MVVGTRSVGKHQAGRAAGLTEEQLDALTDEDAAPFDDVEQAVLKFADQLTRTTEADPDVCQQLRDALGETQFVALTAVVCTANWTNRFNHACGVELP